MRPSKTPRLSQLRLEQPLLSAITSARTCIEAFRTGSPAWLVVFISPRLQVTSQPSSPCSYVRCETSVHWHRANAIQSEQFAACAGFVPLFTTPFPSYPFPVPAAASERSERSINPALGEVELPAWDDAHAGARPSALAGRLKSDRGPRRPQAVADCLAAPVSHLTVVCSFSYSQTGGSLQCEACR